MKKSTFIFDLDETLCTKKQPHETYSDVKPIPEIIEIVNKLHDEGHEIIIETARNMVTQKNHEAKVIKNVGQHTLNWLENNGVKYDGIKFAKTYGAAYCDDKALRPNEIKFLNDTNQLDNIDKYLKDPNNVNIINNNINFLFKKYYLYKWYYVENGEKITFFTGIGNGLNLYIESDSMHMIEEYQKNKKCYFEIVSLFDSYDDAIKYLKGVD